MHFPVPMPAFDALCIDAPYQAVGALAEPRLRRPARDGHRLPRSSTATSTSPATRSPTLRKIAERVEYFQRRAGYYYENWDELYGKWRAKMEALIAEITELARARRSPSTSPTR